MSDAQFERLKHELEAVCRHAPMPGGLCCSKAGSTGSRWRCRPRTWTSWRPSTSAAREIALAFGVPPMLLGIPGDNTYSNYQEANRAFWRGSRAAAGVAHGDEFSAWLGPA